MESSTFGVVDRIAPLVGLALTSNEQPMLERILQIALLASTFGIIILIVLIIWRHVSWYREPQWLKNAPMVPEPSMFAIMTGTVMEYVKGGRICRTFMHDDQPDILRLNNGIASGMFRDFVFCKDPKICREIMEEPNTAKPERGYRAFRRLTAYKGSPDFLSSHSHKDPLYARTRVRAYEVLMKRMVENYDTIFIDCVFSFAERVGKEPAFHVVEEMHLIATSLITRIAFDEVSERFDKDLFESAVWIINDMIARPQNCSMTFLDDLPTPRNMELKRRQNTLITTIETMMANKKKKTGGDDIISILLQDKQNTDNDLLGVLSIFFFAGFDTTSNTMSMMLYHLAANPDVQERCRKDVFDVIGTDTKPKMHKLFHLQYVNAVIKETLRMFPTVPMVTREVTEYHDDGVCPRFKEETTFGVVLNFFGLHYNPKGWNRPNEFLPERWIDPSIDADRDPDQRLYCPFAIGKRACLGRQFAFVEILTVMVALLQRYRICLNKNSPNVKIHEGGTLVVDHGLQLILEPYVAGQASLSSKPTKLSEMEREYTTEEIARHHTIDDLWMIIDGGVYDLTPFAGGEKGGHPGGFEILVAYGGSDGTAEFHFIAHSKFATRMLSRYRIGKVASSSQLIVKENTQKHVLGEAVKNRRRTTVPVQSNGYEELPPLRNFKAA
jgi:cytochrome P450/cytochrome b involved in lipid metabolism